MANLTKTTDLLDVLVKIEVLLYQLGWITIERQGDRRCVELQEQRLLSWAIACCEVGNTINRQTLDALLENLPPEKRWRLARQFLPENAIRALEGKLEALLAGGDRHANG